MKDGTNYNQMPPVADTAMPKDYQEEGDPIFTHLQSLLEVAEGKRNIESWNEIATDLINAYWDYGNARVEGIIKIAETVLTKDACLALKEAIKK
jgi:hypothetical protein